MSQLMRSRNDVDFYFCPLPKSFSPFSSELLSCTVRKTLQYWYLTKLYPVITTVSFSLPNWAEMNNESLKNLTLHIHPADRNKSPGQCTFPNSLFKSLYSARSFCPFPFPRIILRPLISPLSTNSEPKAFVILSMDVLLSPNKDTLKPLPQKPKTLSEFHVNF